MWGSHCNIPAAICDLLKGTIHPEPLFETLVCAGGQLPQVFDFKNLTKALPDAGEALGATWVGSSNLGLGFTL